MPQPLLDVADLSVRFDTDDGIIHAVDKMSFTPRQPAVTVVVGESGCGERATTVGFPPRLAQEAVGHNSKAVLRAYAKRALMKLPSLEEYEERAALKPAAVA